jgi:hypothetical protein
VSKPSTPPSREADIATLRTDVEQLKVLTRGLRPHRLRDHTDVIVQGATPESPLAYGGAAEGGKWRPGTAGGGPITVHWNNPAGTLDGLYSEFTQMWSPPGADLSWFEFPPSYAPTDTTRIFLTAPGMWLTTLQLYFTGAIEGYVEANVTPVCRASNIVTGGGAFVFDQSQIDTSFPEVRVKVDGSANFDGAFLSLTYWPGEPTLDTF